MVKFFAAVLRVKAFNFVSPSFLTLSFSELNLLQSLMYREEGRLFIDWSVFSTGSPGAKGVSPDISQMYSKCKISALYD